MSKIIKLTPEIIEKIAKEQQQNVSAPVETPQSDLAMIAQDLHDLIKLMFPEKEKVRQISIGPIVRTAAASTYTYDEPFSEPLISNNLSNYLIKVTSIKIMIIVNSLTAIPSYDLVGLRMIKNSDQIVVPYILESPEIIKPSNTIAAWIHPSDNWIECVHYPFIINPGETVTLYLVDETAEDIFFFITLTGDYIKII